jgi:energy-coupling factor transporter ATP-binding protein EcfA2
MAGRAPFEGDLRVGGRDPREGPRAMSRVVGYAPQRAEDMFFHASVRAELGPAARELADSLGLTAFLDRHPSTLSGGEQQRLAIACGLAQRPRVLLLDEPSVGLDAAGLAQVLDALDAARRGIAVLVASHDPELRGLAGQVLELREGRVRARRAVEVAA